MKQKQFLKKLDAIVENKKLKEKIKQQSELIKELKKMRPHTCLKCGNHTFICEKCHVIQFLKSEDQK